MLFIASFLVIFIIYYIFMYRNSDYPRKYSRGILVLMLFSFLCNICLGQNYTASLIKSSEGISISNKLAGWIITDKGWGSSWSIGLFRDFYEVSLIISFVLLIVYAVFIFFENSYKKSYYVNTRRYFD